MSHREGRPRRGGFEMLQNLMVPQHLIGQVLGKRRREIESHRNENRGFNKNNR